MAQFGRAPALGAGGRKFESCHPDYIICASGSVVEHHLAKVGAAGSNPVSRSYNDKGAVALVDFSTGAQHLFVCKISGFRR